MENKHFRYTPGYTPFRIYRISGLNMREKKPKKTNRINKGLPTNDLIHTAYQHSNDIVFPLVLKLYIPEGAKVADVTYGKGVFWKNVDKSKYQLFASDLKKSQIPEECVTGIDSRRLPYEEQSFDAIVFDPPYMHTPGGTVHNGHQHFEEYYSNNAEQDPKIVKQIWKETNGRPPKYHEAVIDLYYRSAKEAWRVLKKEGVYIIKCADEVCTNKQRLTHIEIINELQTYGFVVEDLFVVVRTNNPGVSRLKDRQRHARKNHSYFLVFRKPKIGPIDQAIKEDTTAQQSPPSVTSHLGSTNSRRGGAKSSRNR